MLTNNMKKFISANENSPIVDGQRLTSELKQVKSRADFLNSTCVRYKLEDGQTFVLNEKDLASTDYKPLWLIN